jgi:hypothetical protein
MGWLQHLLIGGAVLAGCNHTAGATADGWDGGRAPSDAGDARATATAQSGYDSGIVDEQMPATSGEELTTRTKHLLEAISHDNPDLGSDMLFPRDGYVGSKDSPDPGKAWDRKVSDLFRKQVHHLSRTRGVEKAQFVSFELGHAVVQIVPRKHDWKKPLWRVKHSKLTFVIEGKTHRVDIGEMVAWRGAWYVTRLVGVGN